MAGNIRGTFWGPLSLVASDDPRRIQRGWGGGGGPQNFIKRENRGVNAQF